MHAYRAIQNGDVDTVAIVYGNNQLSASGRTLGTGGGGGGRGGMAMPLPMSYEFPTGLTLVGAYAMAAQRHMHEYGTKPEQLASISVQTREHAGRNPNAMYRDPITVDDVLSSRARRRSAAQARLLRDLRRRLLHHPHHRGTRAATSRTARCTCAARPAARRTTRSRRWPT